MDRAANSFPGMNPFLEQEWPGVHLRLLAYAADDLDSKLPDDLVADGEMEMEIEVADAAGEQRTVIGDVGVKEEGWKSGLPPVWRPETSDEEAEIQVANPVLVELSEPHPARWIEIKEQDGRVITVIEFVSPTNKTTHRAKYLRKRDELAMRGINIVEIDLLRKGRRIVDIDESAWEKKRDELDKTYHICVNRVGFGNRREIYPCDLSQSLPVIRVPLRASDKDVPLDLQGLIDQCHRNRRYQRLDYSAQLKPALSAEEEEWVASRLREAELG